MDAYDKTLPRLQPSARPEKASYDADDVFMLAELLARVGNKYLPRGSAVETTSVDVTSPLQRPYGREFKQMATRISIWPLGPQTVESALVSGVIDVSGRIRPE